jgi:hypothetical protein
MKVILYIRAQEIELSFLNYTCLALGKFRRGRGGTISVPAGSQRITPDGREKSKRKILFCLWVKECMLHLPSDVQKFFNRALSIFFDFKPSSVL